MTIIDSKTIVSGKRSVIVAMVLEGDQYKIHAITNASIEELWHTEGATPADYRGIRRAFRNL